MGQATPQTFSCFIYILVCGVLPTPSPPEHITRPCIPSFQHALILRTHHCPVMPPHAYYIVPSCCPFAASPSATPGLGLLRVSVHCWPTHIYILTYVCAHTLPPVPFVHCCLQQTPWRRPLTCGVCGLCVWNVPACPRHTHSACLRQHGNYSQAGPGLFTLCVCVAFLCGSCLLPLVFPLALACNHVLLCLSHRLVS